TLHDIIGAEFDWDFVRLMNKATALQNFVATDDGENLLAGFKRAANILKAEEKKDGVSFDGAIVESELSMSEEKELYVTLCNVANDAEKALDKEEFELAMGELSELRTPIDMFFDKVIVNSENNDERNNRLKILSQIRSTMNMVIDFSNIEG
ncbi:MAG: DALR anticodon-binding domain-containing protein, partial [Emcibacteraceae bacterium]|nr:DALR anticodon-binding domain-containing protein [Emcibacteraceae bacterium]